MAAVIELTTARLRLRQWREQDLAPWAALNADAETMRYFPSTLTREQSEATARRLRSLIAQRGWGLWAVEVTGGAPFIGFVGLNAPSFEAHFTPAMEIGWRLLRAHWGHGYATEAATAALDLAFGELGFEEIVSFTSASNDRSRAVMARLGMSHDPADDFDHPNLAAGPLRHHVLYRLGRSAWLRRSAAHR